MPNTRRPSENRPAQAPPEPEPNGNLIEPVETAIELVEEEDEVFDVSQVFTRTRSAETFDDEIISQITNRAPSRRERPDNRVECPNCNQLVAPNVLRNVWQQSAPACDKCCKEQGLATRFYYSYKPSPIIFGLEDQDRMHQHPSLSLTNGIPLTIGIENEIEGGTIAHPHDWRSAVTAIQKFLPEELAYFKPDATIEGIEWVMHPMTLKYFYRIKWKELFEQLHLFQTPRVGLHIHLGRHSFTPVLLYKMLQFYEKCVAIVDSVAERKANDYCYRPKSVSSEMAIHHNLKRVNRHNTNAYKEKVKNIKIPPYDVESGYTRDEWRRRFERDAIYRLQHPPVALDHHMIVNVQNRSTIEIRVFAGATTAQQIYKAVQFVVSVYEFCQRSSLMQVTNEDCYLDYLNQNSHRFRVLHSFVQNGFQFNPPIVVKDKTFPIPSARNFSF